MKVEFREGEREIADYLGNLMASLKTHTMSYEEAVLAVNKKLLSDHVNAAQQKSINAHFKEFR